jgi:DNA polymerase-3 subunit delta
MIYLLFGKQDLMIKTRLSKLIKERIPLVDEISLVKYNGRQTPVQDIMADCRSLPLGYDLKMVVIEDAYFLINAKTKEKIEKDQDYAMLVNYLKDPSPATDLVLTIAAPSFNLKSEIGQLLKQQAMIYELTDIDSKSWPEYVRRYFAKYEVTIDQSAIAELVARCQNDATQFVSEAQKLMLYSKHISLDTIKTLVTRPLEENSFALSNALTKGRVDEALTIYRDLKTYNEEPVTLISLLARQFRLMLKVHYLAEEGYGQLDIAKKLDIHEYRVKLALAARKSLDEARLIGILERLYELDYNIKSGQIDRFYGFELFLLNFAA